MAFARTVLFWLHLAAGVLAGAVVLIMSVTGVALTYEKQVIEWADGRASFRVVPDFVAAEWGVELEDPMGG